MTTPRVRRTLDPNAPSRPLSSFNLYTRYVSRQSADLAARPFGERTRLIGAQWATLSAEEKQIYNEQASKEREKYKLDMELYKNTQSYKDWSAKVNVKKAVSNRKTSGKLAGVKRKHDTDDPYSNLPKTNRVPIFTQEFLHYNRQREMSFRSLRKQAAQLEEETALLSKHVENVANAGKKLEQQIKTAESLFASEEAVIQKFRKELVTTFAELAVPTNGDAPRSPTNSKGSERITVSSVNSYLNRLSELTSTGKPTEIQSKAIQLIKNAIKTKTLSLCTI